MRRDDHYRFHRLFFEELNLFSRRNFCVFSQKCPYFHNFDFEELSETVSDFFSRERRFNWSHPLKILKPTKWKVTSVNRCLVFHLFGCKICLCGASFHQNTPIAFCCIFLFIDFLSILFDSVSLNWFLHDFSTLLSDRGSLVYSFLRFNSTFIWIIRSILVARSFDCYFHCINVGLGGSVSYFEILTMRFFGYAEGLEWSLLLAGYYRTLVGESTVNTFHVFHRHSFCTHTNQVTAIYY